MIVSFVCPTVKLFQSRNGPLEPRRCEICGNLNESCCLFRMVYGASTVFYLSRGRFLIRFFYISVLWLPSFYLPQVPAGTSSLVDRMHKIGC